MYGVVIAEDEMLVRIGLKNMLDWEHLGMQVVADASNGQEALDACTRHRPHILITDLRMPVMDGMALIRAIRRQNRSMRIIILTCLDEFHLAQEALSLGISHYILKLTASTEEIQRILRSVRDALDEASGSVPQTRWTDQSLLNEQIFDDFLYYQTLPTAVFSDFVARFGSG